MMSQHHVGGLNSTIREVMLWINAKEEQICHILLSQHPQCFPCDLFLKRDRHKTPYEFTGNKIKILINNEDTQYWIGQSDFITIALPLEEWGVFSD